MPAADAREPTKPKVVVRAPDSIHAASGEIPGGSFEGRWHFSFDTYQDPSYPGFGNIRALNDDTLTPGASWPLPAEPVRELVTYVVAGELRQDEDHGKGAVVHAGGVVRTSPGGGVARAEVNNRKDATLRIVRIWYDPAPSPLPPSVEQRETTKAERTNRWHPLCSSHDPASLTLRADGEVLSALLETGYRLERALRPGRGLYLCVLDGGPIEVEGTDLLAGSAAEVTGAGTLLAVAKANAELLLVEAELGPPGSGGTSSKGPAPRGPPSAR